MADKKASEPTYIEIDGEQLETADVEFRGTTYTLRELTVGEGKKIDTACTKEDGTYDGTLSLTLSLAQSIVSPKTDADDFEKWGAKKYLIMSRAYNKLNSLQAEGNA